MRRTAAPKAHSPAARSAEGSSVSDEVAGWVRAARRLVVLTGAGMSAESGVPTFRDAQTGLWSRFRPEELATEEAFRGRPEMVWDWYAERRASIAQVQPNAGHLALAAYAQRHPGRLTLVTQNVDGLHQRAASPGVLALHGTIAEDRWLGPPRDCCRLDAAVPGRPPSCGGCGNLVRPAVVWFGEMLPADALEAAEGAARACDLMLVVGTSGAVYPAAGLARLAAGRVVVLNPRPSELDDAADRVVRGTAAQQLPQWLKD